VGRRYDPHAYWESRLAANFNLRGVGHASFSEGYNRWIYRAVRRCIESIFSNEDLAGCDVLDVGCGTGFFTDWYLRRGARVTGIDITRTSVERLRERHPQAVFLRCDIGDPGIESLGSFDVVHFWGVAYHIVDDGRWSTALANAARFCKPGGRLLLTDFLGADRDRSTAKHVKHRGLETYQGELARHGLELQMARPLHTYLNRWYRRLRRLNHHAGPLLYFLDLLPRTLPRENLSLGVWRRTRLPR
jgi:SAM-dependent methyltransferase